EIGELAERQTDVFRQRHRAPQRAALVQDSEPPQQTLPLLRRGPREVYVSVNDFSGGGILEADQMAQQRALAAAATAHDDEDVAAPNNEVEIAHQNETAVRHRQVSHDDVRLRAGAIPASYARSHREPVQIPRKL